MTLKLFADATGKKMGKSEGNAVALTDEPDDMYGKVMSWTDGMIVPAFELLTDVSDSEIADIREAISNGENPMQYKRQLAKEIVSSFVSPKAGESAEAHFTSVHQKGEKPEEIPELNVKNKVKLVDVLVEAKMVSSKSDARRQIEQGGVKVDDAVVSDVAMEVGKGALIQKGKRHFVKLV